MAIHRRQNQYRGVNAHLHSYFQTSGGWVDFHRLHIQHLKEALEAALANHPAYHVRFVESLQIALYDLYPSEAVRPTTPEEDQQRIERRRDLAQFPVIPAKPTQMLPVTNLVIDDHQVIGIGIFHDEELVTQLELISPASKPGGSHYGRYVERRSHALRGLVKLVELDYLHRRRSPILDLPDYTLQEADSFPYYVLVSELYSQIGPGVLKAFGFRVEDPIPTIIVPLKEDDVLSFDFGRIYHQTFAAEKLHGLRYVDYAELPEDIDHYDAADQDRIRVRMEMVATQIRPD